MNMISVYLAFRNFDSLFTKYNKNIYIFSKFYTKYVTKTQTLIFFKANFILNKLRQKVNAKN